jgi:hypothetical protein
LWWADQGVEGGGANLENRRTQWIDALKDGTEGGELTLDFENQSKSHVISCLFVCLFLFFKIYLFLFISYN